LTSGGLPFKKSSTTRLRTGRNSFSNADFYKTAPGLGLDAGQFLVEEKVVMVGSDNPGVEVVPNPDPSLAFPVHQLFLARNGIHLLESIITEELAQDRFMSLRLCLHRFV
jgi:kynurenine formamidase